MKFVANDLPAEALTVFALGGMAALFSYYEHVPVGVYHCPARSRSGRSYAAELHDKHCICGGTGVLELL